MTKTTKWLPDREQDFADLCETWKAEFKKPANAGLYGWDADDVAAAMGAIHAFTVARAAYGETDSTKNRMTKDETMAAAKTAMRDFANSSIRYNKKMRPEDRAVFGIREADRTPTPAGIPDSYPEAEADSSIIRQITINFRDSKTKKRGKPRGVHGAEIRWSLLDAPPAGVEELVKSDFDTASPFTLVFTEAERGRRVYFCLRWETTTNVKGPFGEIGSAVIP